ncbi:MAG TPA: hypothetical protein VMU96_00525, partial [Casimicrobiaceae bacterium]|nr:hypothetical protein [Casimicrobiaceae bacterium]
IRRAVTEARAQEAAWLELTALRELCSREGATQEERRALASLSLQIAEANGNDIQDGARLGIG